MLERLLQHETWMDYLRYKTDGMLLSREEEKQLTEFITLRRYIPIAEKISSGQFCFSVPEKRELNKIGSTKKRTVYLFPEDENMVLKLLSYLLYKYDVSLAENCYAFRRSIGAKRAFTDIACNPAIQTMNGFKADISNYFNSIDIPTLKPILERVIWDDPALLQLLISFLEDDRAVWQGEIIHEPRGVMAGTPISPFFANLYLKEMDQYFADRGVIYARYSDDIIIFDTPERLSEHVAAYRRFIKKYHLSSNPDKESFFNQGEKWSFLGFSYDNGTIDIAPITVKKIMDKARRASRSVRRWMLKKEVEPAKALQVFNRKFNRKFYQVSQGHDLCWTRWYFPLINTTKSLHKIDIYLQECQRYLVTGKHNKTGFEKVPYSMMKKCGYKPLVASYYQGKQ